MSVRRRIETNNQSTATAVSESSSPAAHKEFLTSPIIGHSTEMQRISELVSQGNFERAFQLLNAKGEDLESQHAKAVCLMRLGRHREAIEVFRRLVLNPGCIWMREDRPLLYKTNFAMALLLDGHPAGCTAVLSEINNDKHPSVARLRAVIKHWETTMTSWQRFNWRWFVIEPVNRPVLIDFAPGEFVEQSTLPTDPQPLKPTPSLKTAA